jgi:hypothetical protein
MPIVTLPIIAIADRSLAGEIARFEPIPALTWQVEARDLGAGVALKGGCRVARRFTAPLVQVG